MSELSDEDRAVVEAQLGRRPRAMRAVAHRCTCGLVDVVETNPRLEDGTPFPTLYYLTCPKAASAIGRLESEGLMKTMTARLAEDDELRTQYEAAAKDYVGRRDALDRLGHGENQGGMPNRVKCLHVLVAHALAVGRGVNPFGDEALDLLPDWGAGGPCVSP
ncbi:MAG: Ppx/GppA phosphatase [Frankiales bacterium]|nr:Ppx/GppA phosphatase [Frankiales bacterium]